MNEQLLGIFGVLTEFGLDARQFEYIFQACEVMDKKFNRAIYADWLAHQTGGIGDIQEGES
jgi:hypothetical protein